MKLEAIGPEEKDKEWDVLHLEHVAYTPAPPVPKREGTDPSVHTWISEGGREDSLLEAIWSRAVLLPVQSGMKGETVKWVVDHGGKGGQVIRDSRGESVVRGQKIADLWFSIFGLSLRRCVFGKDVLRIFSIGAEESTRCGVQADERPANSIQKRVLKRWCDCTDA